MKLTHRWLSPLLLTLFCVLVVSSKTVCAQTTQTANVAIFPKYLVLGVVYAPPGSASNVSYSESQAVGSTDSISQGQTATKISTTSTTVGGALFGLGASTTNTKSDGYTTGFTDSGSVTITTTEGNSISTMGPISSSLGVDHDNDVIYILLNPAMMNSIGYNSTSGVLASIQWNGIYSNGCDLTDTNVTPTIYQRLSGCDPNQYPYPDIVGIPVWCLKNPYYPGQGCSQWLQYTSRSWDNSYRNPASASQTTAYPEDPTNPPGLTLQDYADILHADPFVVLNGNDSNACHPTYGPAIDPNDPETIAAPINNSMVLSTLVTSGGAYTSTPTVAFSNPAAGGTTATGIANMAGSAVASITVTNVGSGYTSAPSISFSGGGQTTAAKSIAYLSGVPSSCGNTVVGGVIQPYTMNRFQPYGTVEYPVPGPNGLPSTFTGTFQYSNTSTVESQISDSHTTGSSTDTTVGFNNSFGWWGITIASFNASETSGNSNSLTLQNSNTTTNTNTSNSSAGYTIVGPQLSDNYTGPATYSVYMDNVYGTFAFYSPLEPKPTLGTIAITPGTTPATATAALPAFPSTAMGSTSTPIQVTLTNTSSIYSLTMVGPAVTFSDPGFQVVENNFTYPDGCSDQQLTPYGTSATGQTYYCTLYIQFVPQYSDAPNLATLVNSPSLQATMIAAGTENVVNSTTGLSYQNILVTSQESVSGIVTGASQGATLLPAGVTPSSLVPSNPVQAYVYPFPPYSGTPETQVFVFRNFYSTPVTITQVVLSDALDFSIAPGGTAPGNPPPCALLTPVSANSSCTYTVTSINGISASGTITIMGKVPTWYSGTQIQLAGVAVIGNAGTGSITAPAANFQGSCSGTGTNTVPCTTTINGSVLITNGTYDSITVAGGSVTLNTGGLSGSITYNNSYSATPTTTGANTCNNFTAGNTCIVNVGLNVSVPDIGTQYTSGPYTGNFTISVTGVGTKGQSWSVSIPVTLAVTVTNGCNPYPNGCPQAIALVINGTEQSTTIATPATAATGAITLSAASQPSSSHTTASEFTKRSLIGAPSGRIPARELPSSQTLAQSTVSVGVGGFTKAVNIPSGTAVKNAAAMLAVQLNAAGSPVKAVSNGSVISLTTQTTGSVANLPLSTSVIGNYQVTPSGSSLTGGKSAATTTNYDSGTVQVTTNGVTATAEWGSASTPQSVATALAAVINQLAGAYWKATANGGIVSLVSLSSTSSSSATTSSKAIIAARKTHTTARVATAATSTETTTPSASSQITVTVTDSAGFASPSFSVTTN